MLKIAYSIIPPSLNAVYKVNYKTKAFYMDSKAKAFKEGFIKHVTKEYLKDIHIFDTTKVYKAEYLFHYLREEIINEKFGKDKRVKSLYKTIDLDNSIKLLQDSVSAAFGFNDSHIFEFTAKKLISNSRKIEIILCPLEVENI